MQWIQTTNGKLAHIVNPKKNGRTLCGIRLRHAKAIVTPVEERCSQCDYHWRKNSPREEKPTDGYSEKFKFADWDK